MKTKVKRIKGKAGRPIIGSGRRVLLTLSIDPLTADYIKRNGPLRGSRGIVVDEVFRRLVRKGKK